MNTAVPAKKTNAKPKNINHKSAAGLFNASIVVLIISFSMLVLAYSVLWHARQLQPAARPTEGYGTHTPVTMGRAETEVLAVSRQDGQPGFAAPPGKQYLVVDVRVKNLSDKPFQVYPSFDTYVKDSDGTVAPLTPFNLSSPFHSGEILPGDQVRGELSYLVDKAADPKFYIDAIWSGGVIVYNLAPPDNTNAKL